MGRHEQAMVRIKKTQDLDPLSLIISVAVGSALYFARRYDEAIEQLRRTVDLDPNYPVTYWILGALLRKTGCYELAITEGEKGVRLSGGSPLMRAALAHTLGAAGRTREVLQILDDLTKLAKQNMSRRTFSPESTSAWDKANAQLNTCRKAMKSIPTGSSIFIWILDVPEGIAFADEFLAKSADPDLLLKTIGRLLKKRRDRPSTLVPDLLGIVPG